MSPSPGPIAFSREGPLARIVLGPGARVPLLDARAIEETGRSLQAARAAGVRAVVISGGTRGTFVAGADLRELSRLDAMAALEFARRGQTLLEGIASYPGVVLAAIRGRCIGGGFDLAMACDLRLASEEATFSHPGPRMGFITGYGGTSRLPRLVGAVARPILAGLLDLDARAALRLGLVTEVMPAEDLDAAAGRVASRIASVPHRRLLLVKEALRRLAGSTSGLVLERRLVDLAGAQGLMEALVFELAGATYVLKLEAVEKILAPGEPVPSGYRSADLRDILTLQEAPVVDDLRQGHRVLLAGRRIALRVGRPLGTIRLDPAWILPLPGYMFCATPAPFRGILDLPGRRGDPKNTRTARVAQHGLLLDEERIASTVEGDADSEQRVRHGSGA